jgi:hypothetical protein
MEEEINPLDTHANKDGKGNTPCWSEVLRANMDDVIKFNACYKADDIKGKTRTRKVDLIIVFKKEAGESLDCN